MKKICVFIVTLCCAMTVGAYEYPYLVFTNTSGTTTVLGVSNLTLTVSGAQLQVTNADGTTQFTLTDLRNMQFSTDGDTITSIEHVLDATKAVMVYSMTGIQLGSFDSLLHAARSLGRGVYVVTDGTNAQTVVVR